MKTIYYVIGAIIIIGIIGYFAGWFKKKSVPACNSLGLDQSQIDALKAKGGCK